MGSKSTHNVVTTLFGFEPGQQYRNIGKQKTKQNKKKKKTKKKNMGIVLLFLYLEVQQK